MTGKLVEVVSETMQPDQVSVWLKSTWKVKMRLTRLLGSLGLFIALAGLVSLLAWVVVRFSTPRPRLVLVGPVQDFLPGEAPRLIDQDSTHFYVLNVNGNLGYIGAGPSAYLGDPFQLGITGEIGLEYHFDIPLAIGADWRPTFILIEDTDFEAGWFGFNLRHVFGK